MFAWFTVEMGGTAGRGELRSARRGQLGRRDAFTLGLLLKYIQSAKLVKAHLAHSSVPAGTKAQRVSRPSSTKRSE